MEPTHGSAGFLSLLFVTSEVRRFPVYIPGHLVARTTAAFQAFWYSRGQGGSVDVTFSGLHGKEWEVGGATRAHLRPWTGLGGEMGLLA